MRNLICLPVLYTTGKTAVRSEMLKKERAVVLVRITYDSSTQMFNLV